MVRKPALLMVETIANLLPARLFLLTLLCFPVLAGATPPQRVELPEVMPGQFYLRASRPSYRNFAFQPYTNYPGHTAFRSDGTLYSDAPRAIYSSMGDYLTTGYDLYSWTERRGPETASAGGKIYGSSIFKHYRVFLHAFGNLVVARDSQVSWGYSAILGDALIARFTPLTLSEVDFDGVRLDLTSSSLQATLLGSRPERPGYSLARANWYIENTEFADASPLLLGGRLQGNLGRLQLGMTGVNLHMFHSTASGNTLKGVLRPSQPLIGWVLFRFTDDSPADGRGGAVVQKPVLIVNGVPRSDLQARVIRHRAGVSSQVGTVSQATGEFRAFPYHQFRSKGETESSLFYRSREVPLYADYLYLIDHLRGENVSADTNLESLIELFRVESSDQVLQADGNDQLVYLFDISREPYVESVELEVVLSNDYKVDVATLIDEDVRARKRYAQFRTTYYHTALRAKGNVQDRSNLQRVRLEVGENTALFTYSADAHLSLVGMEVHGEVARSRRYSRYPAEAEEKPFFEKGARSSEGGMAYFVNATGALSRGRLGLEYFSMQPDFTTEIRHHLPTEADFFSIHLHGVRNRTMYWQLVQDNDDGDRFADTRIGQPLGHVSDFEATDPDGVFPGRDEDRDGIPDTNRNFNSLPDYAEPFLMFDVEPNEYVYGLDRNHNDEPDVREDDLRPDYPYFPDQRGYHLFLQVGPASGWSAMAGRYAVEEMAGDGRNRSTYALLTFRGRDTRESWRLFFENYMRRVEDDIVDEFAVQVEQPQVVRGHLPLVFVSQIRPDPLSYRDSYVNETYLEAELQPWSALRWVNKWRLRLNWQQGGGDQRARRLDYWTLVQRAEYSATWGKLTVRPQCKVLLLHHVDQDGDRLVTGAYAGRTLRSELSLIPILRIQYPLFRRTILRVGVQGWGPLPYKRHDRVRERDNLERRTVFATLANRSAYRGYDLHTIIGLQGDSMNYDDRLRRGEEYDTWSFFVRVLTGFTEFGPLI